MGTLPANCLDPETAPQTPTFAEGKFGGKGFSATSAVAQGVGAIFYELIQREKEKEGKVKNALERLSYCFPGYNVVIAQPHDNSTQHMTGAVLVTTLELSDTEYRVYVFKSGVFYQAGDLGYKNWAYAGYFNKSADGRTVTFSAPPVPQRRAGWTSGPQCQVTTRDRLRREMYYGLVSPLDHEAQGQHVRMLVNDLRSCFPDYNIMVMHDEQPHEWVSPPTSLVWASSFTMQDDVEPGETTEVGKFGPGVGGRGHYDVWVFKKGTFHNRGDGGYNNWAFYGNYSRSADGMTVAFSEPAQTDLSFDPMRGFADVDFGSNTAEFVSTANGPFPGCNYTGSVPGDRAQLVQALVSEYQRCFPNTNILVVKSVGSFSFGYLSRFRHLATVNGMSVFALDIGTVLNRGDGGWINWGFSGVFEREGESVVNFWRPKEPEHPVVSFGALRVMPLGDSITAGLGSSTGSSYRAALWDALTAAGASLDFVGSQRGGTLPDIDHEGYPGWLIEEIAGIATQRVSSYRPNVVTLMIGTNDMVRNNQVQSAPDRLGNLIDQILQASPGTTVVVANLTPSQDAAIQGRIDAFNPRVLDVVLQRQQAGMKVEFVDMGSLTTADLADVVHPNDEGYRKMAAAFLQGIQRAAAKGWIAEPADVPPPQAPAPPVLGPTSRCEDVPPGWLPRGQVARGGGAASDQTALADLNGDGRADYIVALDNMGAIRAWINEGGDRPGYDGWRDLGQVALGAGVPFSRLRFADLDGDGAADYLVLGEGGSIRLYRNNGMDRNGVVDPSPDRAGWMDMGQAAAGTGYALGQIHFADINADGLADYLVTLEDGALLAWLNHGTDALGQIFLGGKAVPRPAGPGWLEQGKIAAGAGPGHRVRFADIDGDRRADYLVVGDRGELDAWLNNGGDVPGGGGWIHVGQVASGTGSPIEALRFVDMDGDRKDDYVVVAPDTGALALWTNHGGNQSKGPGWVERGQIAAGAGPADRVRFADLNGDRRDDYLVVGGNGALRAYFNNGGDLFGDANRPQGPGWIDYGIVAAGTGDPIEELRFADFDGDGWDDYWVLDPAQGALSVWRNEGGDIAGGRGWRPLGQVALGTGDPIDHIDFADVNGDRRADYLIFGDDGSIHAWLNRGGDIPGGSGWQDIGVIATGVGEPRQRIRLAHLNCDDAVDYLAVADDNGALRAWVNSGSDAPVFSETGQVARGAAPGALVRFADINGDGRDDYVVLHENGALDGWLNAGGDLTVGGGGQPYL